MFDRFVDEARQSLGHARQASQRLCHDSIGPEHVLLGILDLPRSVASCILDDLGVDRAGMVRDIEKRLGLGTAMHARGQIPFAPEAERVLDHTLAEASALGHCRIGTQHLLLGLVVEGGMASQALPRDVTREAVLASPHLERDVVPPANPTLSQRVEALERRAAELDQRIGGRP